MSNHEVSNYGLDKKSYPQGLLRVYTLLQEAQFFLIQSLESPLPSSQVSPTKFAITNSPIPFTEHDNVKGEITTLKNHENFLGKQAAMARTLVECLEAQIKRYAEKTEDLKILIAPHKSLPDHLLSEIFLATIDHELCIPTRAWLSCGRSKSTTEAPWSLLQVCSRWRRVALGDVRLWNKLCLLYRPSIPRVVYRTQKALAYGQNSPLHLCGTDEATRSLQLDDRVVREILIPHSKRIARGNFSIRPGGVASCPNGGFEGLRNLPKTFLTSLEELVLYVGNRGPDDYPVEEVELWRAIGLFLRSSHLDSVSLYLKGRQINPETSFPLNLPLRWNSLKRLRIEDVAIEAGTVHRLLEATSANLIEIGVCVAPFQQYFRMLEVPRLQTLYLVGDTAKILDSLNAPNLQRLYYRPPNTFDSFSDWQQLSLMDEQRTQMEMKFILHFLAYSSASLKHLHLVIPSIYLDLEPFLKQCPSLETLETINNRLTISSIQHLTEGKRWPKEIVVSMKYLDLHFLEASLTQQFGIGSRNKKRRYSPNGPRSMKIILWNNECRPVWKREISPAVYNQMEARLMNVCPEKVQIRLMPYESLINRY